jgi:hypothetical protein
MMKKVSGIFIFIVFVLIVITSSAARTGLYLNEPTSMEMILSAHSGETFDHDHCKEMEMFHEDFFQQSGLFLPSELRTPSQNFYPVNITVPLKFTQTHWHPPKLI